MGGNYMQVEKEEILHIANLACLNIKDEEIDEYRKNLEDILNFATLPMHRKPNPRNRQRDKKPRGLVIFNQYNIRLV